MNKCVNGKMIAMTDEEIAKMQADAEEENRKYWSTVDYGEAVNALGRERYSESQEFAILRQKDEKPEEFQEYFDYMEWCKAHAQEMMAKYGNGGDHGA